MILVIHEYIGPQSNFDIQFGLLHTHLFRLCGRLCVVCGFAHVFAGVGDFPGVKMLGVRRMLVLCPPLFSALITSSRCLWTWRGAGSLCNPVFGPHSTGAAVLCWLFRWKLGIWTHVLMLALQVLLPIESSPWPQVYAFLKQFTVLCCFTILVCSCIGIPHEFC